jgi:hypothetical protein
MLRMSFTSYFLLGALSWSAVAGCGGSEDCLHSVTVTSGEVKVGRETLCKYITSVSHDGLPPQYGIPDENCPSLCGDPAMNRCSLPSFYIDALEAANGPVELLTQADSGVFELICPEGTTNDLPLDCRRVESRGKNHGGCPIY